MAGIGDIDGLGQRHRARLEALGITSSDDLLAYGATRRGRIELSKATGLGVKRVHEWVKRADLLRVPGIHVRYSDLLEAAGIDTVKQLRRRNPRKLAAELEKLNDKRSLVRRLPSESELERWIDEAKALPVVLKG